MGPVGPDSIVATLYNCSRHQKLAHNLHSILGMSVTELYPLFVFVALAGGALGLLALLLKSLGAVMGLLGRLHGLLLTRVW